jgi:hypothetical protein
MGFVAAPVLLVASSWGWAQAPAPPTPPTPVAPPKPGVVFEEVTIKIKPGSLEELLAEALKNNPDVKVAESKLREAEAQLQRARMQVMQKAVALRGSVDAQEGAVKEAEALLKAAEVKVKRFSDLHKKQAIDQSTVDEAIAALEAARAKLLAAKAKLAEIDGEMNFLQGKHRMRFTVTLHDLKAPGEPAEKALLWLQRDIAAHAVRNMETYWVIQAKPGSTGDKIRKALDKPVSVEFKNKPLADLVKDLQTAHGINFVVASKKVGETPVTVQASEMPLGAVLEMIEDIAGVKFAVRDYGVLATSAEQLPTGAVPLYTFWKAAKAEADKPKEGKVEIKR